MSKRILVAYASRFGSTAGVAECIGKVLSEGGLQADVRPMSEAADISAYDAVVAGSAINGSAWLPGATEWVRQHQAQLSRKPFAAFLVCMTLTMRQGDEYRSHVATWLQPVRAMVRPVSEGLFPGALDIKGIPSFSDRLKFRLSVLFGVWKEGDHRDWHAVREWTQQLQRLL